MAEEYRALYRAYAVEPYRVACAYLGSEERFFVVARCGR